MIQTEEKKEKFILVGVETGKDRMEESLSELEELLDTAGGETVRFLCAKITRLTYGYIYIKL